MSSQSMICITDRRLATLSTKGRTNVYTATRSFYTTGASEPCWSGSECGTTARTTPAVDDGEAVQDGLEEVEERASAHPVTTQQTKYEVLGPYVSSTNRYTVMEFDPEV